VEDCSASGHCSGTGPSAVRRRREHSPASRSPKLVLGPSPTGPAHDRSGATGIGEVTRLPILGPRGSLEVQSLDHPFFLRVNAELKRFLASGDCRPYLQVVLMNDIDN
jgi:hypothetical protein